MALRQLLYAPHPIFSQTSESVAKVDDAVRALVQDLFDTLEVEQGIGMAAPMVGVKQRVIVVDLYENGVSHPLAFINPEIVWRSEEMQEQEEASLCFVGISAEVKRPYGIRVRFLDMHGLPQEMSAEGLLASVVQHEMDYLDGKTFLDHLSRLKRDTLLKKMNKHLKMHPPHVHGAGCSHHHH
jgi:peptide deformylase